eukprot:364597-Chlamydomonas_euryale.AAC.4
MDPRGQRAKFDLKARTVRHVLHSITSPRANQGMAIMRGGCLATPTALQPNLFSSPTPTACRAVAAAAAAAQTLSLWTLTASLPNPPAANACGAGHHPTPCEVHMAGLARHAGALRAPCKHRQRREGGGLSTSIHPVRRARQC